MISLRARSEPFSTGAATGTLSSSFRPPDLVAAVAAVTDPGQAVKTLHWGRNYLYVSRLETAAGPVEVVVKQFRAASLRDRLNHRLKGTKAARSWKAALALVECGLETPEPVMLIERAGGPSYYLCRYLPGLVEARYLFRAAAAREEAVRFPEVDFPAFVIALGRTIRRLHDAGLWHRDLSGGNLLLRFGEEGKPTGVYLVDLNRMRCGRRLTVSERTRDLSRLALDRPEHRALLLATYWGDSPGAAKRGLYAVYRESFLLKNRAKGGVRKATARVKGLFGLRGVHAHIPEAPRDAAARDKAVWDRLSDQPHQHARPWTKLAVRLSDAPAHLETAAAVAGALPRIHARYRELKRRLYQEPTGFSGAGIALRPYPADPEAPLRLTAALGCRSVLLRLHPWEGDHAAELALARALAERGCELTFALPQSRELVKDLARWRAALTEIAETFLPYGRRFQIGQAINRSKWGLWTLREYVALAETAEEVLRGAGEVELLGPAVIDFEFHLTAAVLNLRRRAFHFDAVSALLYVDRRGAPESRQAGFDTVDKVVLLKAIAETARNAGGRCYVTEVNWPLREGPHSPAGRAVSVDEETQADYLVRYFLLSLGTGLLERVFWWQMIARGYGLVDPAEPTALRRRPSFAAFRALLAVLDGARLEDIVVEGPARLYRFRARPGAEVIAAWSASGGSVRAALPRRPVAVIGRDGQNLPVPDGHEIDLGPSPAYFFFD